MTSVPLSNIQLLIPVPSDQPPRKHGNGSEEDLDRFASLFSPPTPPASRSLTPMQTQAQAAKPRHRRADSDFGAFVSVPASDDPLRGVGADVVSSEPIQNFAFFDKFTEEAKAATQENRRDLVDELLKHEDDPLYWVAGGASGSSTPSNAVSHSQSKPSLSDAAQGQSEVADLLDLTTEPAKAGFDQISRHLTRNVNATELTSPPPPPAEGRSQSQGPSHSRRRSRSSTLSSIPTKWISSLLSNPRTSAATTTPTPIESSNASGYFTHPDQHSSDTLPHPIPQPHTQPHQSTLPASLPSYTLSFPEAPPGHASSISSSAKVITHGTPFAAHTFVPPSGAPGFGGDRAWNKSGFEFKKEEVEGKSVRLVGRKEMTSVVLTVEVADMVRAYLPALARLPRSWTLLYSLDQHGISLSTLYTRCQNHPGGALLAIRDAGDTVFGAWVGDGLHPSKGAYYGGGESFLWKMYGEELKVYRWAGKNDYVALCEPDYISFGGGDGHYGLYLDDTLLDGSSARSITFGNEPLCSKGPRKGENVAFECVGLEIWGMGP